LEYIFFKNATFDGVQHETETPVPIPPAASKHATRYFVGCNTMF
jgi:hypothetical protein